MDLMQRRRQLARGVKYPELQLNKAWQASNGGEYQPAPVDEVGYAVTPFYPTTAAAGRIRITVHGGYTTALYAGGCIVFKRDSSQSLTTTAYLQNVDPKIINASGTYQFVSATLKMSELDNCYIYDNNAATYLWAGRNVNTSAPPIS